MLHLLQIPIPTNFLNAVLNQGPCVCLLLGAVMWLNKKNNDSNDKLCQLENKLETYLAEDREKMQTVIDNNTRVMQQFLDHKIITN